MTEIKMKILLPVDGTPASLHAVRHALALRAQGLQAEFVLVNVQVPPSLYEVVVAHDPVVLDDVRRAAGADLLAPAEALLQAAAAEWESEVAGGDPGHVLVDLIDNYGCNAVVLGASGNKIGAVPLALLQHSPVPVTVVREPPADR
ncbi:MAG: universal stress protein [Rubrivivax sp.]